jgi:hypothetical protein
VLLSIVSYLASIAIEVLSRGAARHELDTLVALFGRGRPRDASGVAILRGCAIGLLLLAGDTLMLWIATTIFSGRLSMLHVGLMGGIINGSAWPTAIVAGVTALHMVGLPLLVAFASAVVERLRLEPWLATIAAAALLAATGIRLSMATVQPVRFTLVTLFVDYALLVAAFRAFDLLTLSAAIGTFAFWWTNYPLLVMEQPTGAAGPWIAFGVWGLVVAAAAVVAFQSGIRRVYQRAAAAVD